MKKFLLSGLLLLGMILISGCAEVTEVTPENVDVIAQAIQSKYNTITAYESKTLEILNDGSIIAGRMAAKKPDKYFDMASWEGTTLLSHVEVCNGQKDQIYTSDYGRIDTYDRDCKPRVDSVFEVIDTIKKIANYKNTIKLIKLSHANGDYKEILFLGPTSSYEKDKAKILATSSGGFSIAERNVPGQLENWDGVEASFTDETGHTYKMIFLASTYQIIKIEQTSQSGEKRVHYYSDIQFNDDVQDNYFTMPTIDEINALKETYG